MMEQGEHPVVESKVRLAHPYNHEGFRELQKLSLML